MLFILLAGTLVFAGCGKKEEVAASTEQVVENVTTDVVEDSKEETVTETETKEGMYRSELTNEWIDESLQNQRPIAAMVDNELTALPHYGLSQADVVYEITNSAQNQGVTRFMVMVKDWEKIEQLGSIRSVRPTNLQIAPEWNAVVCHDGGPFYINAHLANPYVENFSGTFSRVNNGKAREFTEYILPGDLDKNFADKGYSTEYNQYYAGPHYQFASESDPVDLVDNTDAIDCTHIDLPYKHNKPFLDYDAETGLYNYSEYGKAHVDPGNNDAQMAFKNLLIQNAKYQVFDDHGYMAFYILDSGREGYYITNGKAIPVTWTKESDLSPTKYYDKDGNEITINTGKTYVAIVPDDIWSDMVIE